MSSLWHLAIESSGLGGSAALFRYHDSPDGPADGEFCAQVILPANQGSVRSLAPAIEKLLRDAQIKPAQLSSLSVTQGPGSFTGLRVGLATAKMLAWVHKIPVVPVDTLAAIALRFTESANQVGTELPGEYRLVTAINAFRKQVFTSCWQVDAGQATCVAPAAVVNADKWLADPWQATMNDIEAANRSLPLWISGAAIQSYPGLDIARCQIADSSLWQPLAEQVGRLGLIGLAQGQAVTADELAPNYIRSSAAEENAAR